MTTTRKDECSNKVDDTNQSEDSYFTAYTQLNNQSVSEGNLRFPPIIPLSEIPSLTRANIKQEDKRDEPIATPVTRASLGLGNTHTVLSKKLKKENSDLKKRNVDLLNKAVAREAQITQLSQERLVHKRELEEQDKRLFMQQAKIRKLEAALSEADHKLEISEKQIVHLEEQVKDKKTVINRSMAKYLMMNKHAIQISYANLDNKSDDKKQEQREVKNRK